MKRHFLKSESLKLGSKLLKPLVAGDCVYIQNQAGPSPKKWSKSGTILEALPHDSYLVKVHGSNHITQRNRKFLRMFTPFSVAYTETTPTVAMNSLYEPEIPMEYQDTPITTMMELTDSLGP